MHRWRVIAPVLMLLLAATPRLPVTAQTDEACFPETNHCVEGRFRQYWEQNGGVPVFGFPIINTRSELNRDINRAVPTQWFERNRFELHAENAAPYDVLLGRLGDDRLRQLGRAWQEEPRHDGPAPGCRWFQETRLNVCDQAPGLGFKTYWETHGLDDPALDEHGESLALFGLPLTAPRMETNSSGDTVLTQWFERARFEWHPDKPDQHKVLLGLLGREVGPPSHAPPAEGHPLLFSVPQGAEGITYRGENMPEQQVTGPAGFTMAPDGSLWLLDTMAERLLHYSPTGQRQRVITFEDAPLARSLVDIAVTASDVYVLDTKPTPPVVLRLSPEGQRRGEYAIPAGYHLTNGLTGIGLDEQGRLLLELDFGTRLFRLIGRDGTVAPQPLPGHVFRGTVYTAHAADFNRPESDLSRGHIMIGDKRVEVIVEHALGGLTIIGFAPDGSFYVRLEEVGPNDVDQTVRRYTADGQLLGMARRPINEQHAYVQQPFAVAPSGALYTMMTRPDHIEIRQLRFTPTLPPVLPSP